MAEKVRVEIGVVKKEYPDKTLEEIQAIADEFNRKQRELAKQGK